MSAYKSLLVAIDLTDESKQILDRAQEEARLHGANLSLVHILKPIMHVYGGFGAVGPGDYSVRVAELEVTLQQQARERVTEVASQLGIPAERTHTLIGNPAGEIRRLLETQEFDLLVIGTHSRHGLGRLLGSTANSVLHGIEADALIVRVRAT